MSFRLSPSAYAEGKANDGNKQAMQRLVRAGRPTGLLGFCGSRAIAWCAFAPREDFVKLERSRVHRRIDDAPVWSVPCTFIAKDFRRQGVSVELLRGLIRYAREQRIRIIEAYPTIPTQGRLPDAFAWIGLYRSFERAGFQVVDRTSANRPMVRYVIDADEPNQTESSET
ncbi:MAG: GNAT family N-acetyltransferase [Gemmatimonadaceae bacterium]|nr:GNAT family N-acetyltransferase [Gemmatimonadaceae bacterium]